MNKNILIVLIFITLTWGCKPKSEITENHINKETNASAEVPVSPDASIPPSAVPAMPGNIYYEMPNGYILNIRKKGDEFSNKTFTVDGYLILENPIGFYEYAIYSDDNQIVLSGLIASNLNDRSESDVNYLNSKGIKE